MSTCMRGEAIGFESVLGYRRVDSHRLRIAQRRRGSRAGGLGACFGGASGRAGRPRRKALGRNSMPIAEVAQIRLARVGPAEGWP